MPLGALLACAPARANPTGGQVVAGQATISNPNANTVAVGQSSERAVINWQSFSIGQGQTTVFQQPNQQAVTVNQVTGSDLSTIAGQLRANGQVILINQSGIVFSQGAQVDTGGLIATTTGISTKRFMAGQTAFTVPSTKPHASVVNRGRITVAQAGLAALVAPSVANSGVITANLGRVVLAGAQTFTADLYGDGLVSFDITSRVSQSPGAGGALVTNTGQITADGGHILLTADAVDGIIGDLVDAGGTVQARNVGGHTGAVEVIGQSSGIVTVSGQVDVSGTDAGQKGGKISVLGDRVGLLDGASLNASGQAGGGLVLVGGNFHGKGPQQNARVTYVGPTARVDVNALGGGNGGGVAIWASQQTAFYGLITAQGGLLGGNGGHVEVSGHNLDFEGAVALQSPRGQNGSLLLDPAIVNIDNNTSIPNQDNKLPTILASDDPGATDHLLASAIDAALQSGSVSIAATESINVNATISGLGQNSSSLSLAAPVITVAGDISVEGNLNLNGAVTLDSPSGNVNLTAANLNAGQIAGANSLDLFVDSGTLHGINVTTLSINTFGDISSPSLQLDSGTYAVQGGTLAFGTVTTSGSLVLGSTETDFAEIELGGDTTLDASAAGGVVKLVGADATTSYGQALSIITSGSGSAIIDAAGQTTPLSTLSITGTAILGEGQLGTTSVGIYADTIDIPGPITNLQSTTITTDRTGTIILGPATEAGGGDVFIGMTLSAGSGGVTLSGFNETTFYTSNSGPLRFDTGTYETSSGFGTEAYSGVETSGTLSFGQPTSLGVVTLVGNTSFSGAFANVQLTLTSLDAAGPYSATFNDPANLSGLTFLGPIGATGPLAALTVNIAGSTTLSGNITAASVTFDSAALVQANVAVDASSGATFAAVSTGGAEGSLNFTADTGNVSLGAVNLEGELGTLGTLSAASTVSTVTLGGNVTAGSVDLAGPVAIPASVQTTISTIDREGTGGPITLGQVSGSSGTLLLQAGNGAVSLAGFDVAGITVDTTGTIDLNSGTYTAGGTLSFTTVTTAGTLVLGSAETDFQEIILASDTRLDATAGGGTINITGVDATTLHGEGLDIATSSAGLGALYLVGQTEPLSFFTATGNTVFGYGRRASPGTESNVSANTITVAGPFTTDLSTSFAGETITLGQALGTIGGTNPTGLYLGAGPGPITLGGVTEGFVTFTTTGQVVLDAGTYIIGAGSAYSFSAVTTSGVLSFGQPTSFGAVTLAADTTFQGYQQPEALTLASLDSASGAGPFSATFAESGAVSLGPVGQVGPLESLIALATVTDTTLTGNVVASSVNLAGPVSIGAGDTILISTLGTLGTSGPITLGQVTSLGVGGGLDLDAGSSPISLSGFVVPSASIVTTGVVSLGAGTYTTGGTLAFGNVSTDGSLVFGQPTSFGAVSLAADTTLDSAGAGGALALGPVSGPFALSIEAGAGNVVLAGAEVGSLAIANTGKLTLDAGTYSVASGSLSLGGVTTGGALSFGQTTSLGLLTLAANTTLATSGQAALTVGGANGGGFGLSLTAGQGSQPSGALAVTGPIDGVGSLVLAGGAVALNAAIGASVPVGTVSVDSFANLVVSQPITATGDVTLQAASGQSGIAITAPVQSVAGDVSLLAAGDVTLQALVSATGGTLLLTSGGNIAEQGQGSVQAGVLAGSANAGSATFGSAGNQIAALAGFSTGGDLLIDDAVALTVLGPAASGAILQRVSAQSQSQDVNAGGQATLMDAASLTVDAGASIAAQTVSLGAFGGVLSVNGVLAPTDELYLAGSGGLALGASAVLQAGGTVRADSGAGVSFASGSTISAGGDVWVGYGASAAPVFEQYGYTALPGVADAVTDAAAITAGGNVGLQASGTVAVEAPVNAGTSAQGGNVFLATLAPAGGATPGDILIGGAVTASAGTLAGSGTVSLDAAGIIDEQAGSAGAIQAAVLVGQSGGWASLGGSNRVATLASFQTLGQIGTTTGTNHEAGTSFTFIDASALSIAAAPYSQVSAAAAASPPGGPLPVVTQAVADGSISGPGSVIIDAPGFGVTLSGAVSISSGSFVALAGSFITQTGVLTLSAPVSLLDVSGVPLADVLTLFGANGSAAAAAFASGKPRPFLDAYENLIGADGDATAAAPVQLADVAATNPGSNLILSTDQAPLSGTVDAAGLSVISAGGTASLAGMIGKKTGKQAANLGFTSFGPTHASQFGAVTFNACDLGAINCGVVVPPAAPALAIVLNTPLQPQLVAASSDSLGAVTSGLDTQQSQPVVRAFELLPFDEMQQDRTFDEFDVDRLDTGREDDQ
jgi:filamentous hemagglutinin family protein